MKNFIIKNKRNIKLAIFIIPFFVFLMLSGTFNLIEDFFGSIADAFGELCDDIDNYVNKKA